MRQSCLPAVFALLALSACSGDREPGPVDIAREHIDCALGGSSELKPACSVERIEGEGGLTLVVHHPDGVTRRFVVRTDGTGLVPQKGAKPSRSRLVDHRLEVTVGADRYLFPVTVTPDAPR